MNITTCRIVITTFKELFYLNSLIAAPTTPQIDKKTEAIAIRNMPQPAFQ